MLQRNKYQELLAHASKPEHTILIGARQTGKSTLLKQLGEALSGSGERVTLLNLERKNILSELNQSPEHVFKYLPLHESSRAVVLIDEVQYLDDPTNFLKLLYDEYAGRLKIIASGSSAFYIDRQFKDSLAGRKKIFELSTLDFAEFLLFQGKQTLLEQLDAFRAGNIQLLLQEDLMWAALEEYVTYGGYPAVVLEESTQGKVERLQELRDSFIKRDVLESGITDETKFYRLMIFMAGQTGNLLNISELSNTLRLTHSVTEEYIHVMQKCFHIGLLRPFYHNVRKELTKMPKVYFNDLGLRNVLIGYFAPLEQRIDKGALLENYVYRRLTELYPKDQLKFWRTTEGNEVDFVIEENGLGGSAVEVKFNPSETHSQKYKKFTESYPAFPLRFLAWREPALLR